MIHVYTYIKYMHAFTHIPWSRRTTASRQEWEGRDTLSPWARISRLELRPHTALHRGGACQTCIYIDISIYLSIYVYMYIYIYRERERERERDRYTL